MMNPAEFANIAKAENDFWWYRGMRQIMYGLLDPVARDRKFGRVLEAGCGTGFLLRRLPTGIAGRCSRSTLAGRGSSTVKA